MQMTSNGSSLVISLVLLIGSTHIQAAGFANLEQSVVGIGLANAGVTAGALDLSTIFFNPAGLSKHNGTQILSGMHIVKLNARFHPGRSTDILGNRLSGGSGGNPGKITPIPNLYIATDINHNTRIGLGINAPFGLSSNYDDNWQGRYHALTTKLKTININPTIAYAVNEKFSVGFGVNAQYFDLDSTNAIDFGTVCLAALQTNSCPFPGLTPQAADGEIESEVHDWSWGYNLGVLFELSPETRIGVAYRSKISHTLQGRATFKVPAAAAPLTANGAFSKTRVKGDVDLPETIAIGAFHQFNHRWAIMGDITWTRWNRFKETKALFENPVQPAIIEPQKWENTFRYSLGATFQYDPSWKFLFGYSYDETPVPNAELRSVQFADSNRNWLATGVQYRYSDQLNVDLSFAYVFIQNANINRIDSQQHTLNGEFEAGAYIISGQMGWKF